MSALPVKVYRPPTAAVTTDVLRPVGTTPIACAGTVAASALKLSSTDCVEKLQLITTSAALTPTAWPMARCALVRRHTALSVALVIVLQSAGAALIAA